ncbi:unnamed protein product [Durusdinium trenchii]|uniref:RING-type domain-containing protein n=1 Tax=Durusdinium trenchii TaxID=1381693 RepID=A0ABP0SU36_9DINO
MDDPPELLDTQTSLASTQFDSLSEENPDGIEDPEALVPAEGEEEAIHEALLRASSRGDLEVTDVNLSGRAQRRLARHARRARIPLVSRALVVEDDFVDVEQVASEVLDAERDRLLRLDVSSDEGVGLPARAERRRVAPVRSAALSVNTGRQVRLQRPKRRTSTRRARGRPSASRSEEAPRARVSNFSWSAAGFEGQPSGPSSSSTARPEPDERPGPGLPSLLEVPLSPDNESPPADRENTLPDSWFLEPDDATGLTAPHFSEPGGGLAGFSCIYVEPVRSGMEPRSCGQCHCPFGPGELRLGYTPCGVAADGRQFLPVWVHAFVCTRRARLAIRFDGEAVSFSPAVPLVDRNRLVDELKQLHQSLTQGPRRSQPRQLCIRPWRYIPSVLQRWPIVRLNEQAAASSSEGSRQRPAWRLPSPPRATHGGDVAEFLETEGDLGARHVQEVLAQLVSGGVSGVPVVAAPRPELIPNFLAREPENADVTRLLAEVPVFALETKAEEPCVVCREEIQVGQLCRRLPCFHLFHRGCIDQWISVKATCPLDNLKLEDMLSQQHSLEVGEEPVMRRRSRSRSPLPRTWSEPGPEPRARSSWDVRHLHRSRWDPEPWSQRRGRSAWYWNHWDAPPPPPPTPPPALPARPPGPPTYPPPMMPSQPARPFVSPMALQGPQGVANMPGGIPNVPATLPFAVPMSVLMPRPGFPHAPPPGG